MNKNLKGFISKIRVLKYDKDFLLRFTLINDDNRINCLVANKILIDQIMTYPDDKIFIAAFGNFNSRNQFVVRKMA